MDLVQSIRALPDCVFGGPEIQDYLGAVADELITQVQSDRSFLPDFGEGSTIYSVQRATDAANQLRNYGKILNSGDNIGKPFCRASEERNKIISLLGNAFGYVSAHASVNATLRQAGSDFVDDLNVGGAGFVGLLKWLVVGAIAIAVTVAIVRFKP